MIHIKRKIAIYVTNHVLAGTRPWSFKLKRGILNWGGFSIGKGTKVVGPIYIYGSLTVGDNTWIGKNMMVNGNGNVIIGDNCDIAPEVTFQTGGHIIGTHHRRAGKGQIFQQVVGNGVWVGGRTTFLNNVTIGNGAVIAGCACVNKDVSPDVIVGGVPAKFIKDLK